MEDWREKVLKTAERLRGYLKEPQHLRRALIVIGVLGITAALFVYSEATMASEQTLVLTSEATDAEKRAVVLPVRELQGGKAAVDKEGLGNPFLPGHPKKGEMPVNVKQVQGKGIIPAAQNKGKAQVQGSVPANAQGNYEAAAGARKKIELQGIINEGGNQGALLYIDGKVKFLAAGESWGGCSLEAVDNEGVNVAANGQSIRLQVGEAVG